MVRLIVEADGGSRGNPGPAGFGAVVRDADSGEIVAEVADGIGRATNNVAEYRGLIAGLEAAAVLQPESVDVRMDSKLVVEQMSGRWQVKHPDMATLKAEADVVARRLRRVRYTHIPRAQNSHADRLANEAMDAAARGDRWVRRTGAAAAVSANRIPGWMPAAEPPTTTLLLRHGETELSVERRFSGIGNDPELTGRGRIQVAAAADRIGELADTLPIAAIYSSPLRRARATADAVARRLGLDVAVDERLRETDFGVWDGHTFGEVRERWPAELDAWLASTSTPPPQGESFDQALRRVRRARVDLIAKHPGETVLVVTHVTPIKLLLRIALDAGPGLLYRLHLDLASLSVVDWYADGAAVVRLMNDTAHLGVALDTDGLSRAIAEPTEPVSTT